MGGSSEFETTFNQYVSQVEQFVGVMHSGLNGLSETTAVKSASVQIKTIKKVLVVDSAEINRVLFGRYFQDFPFEITFARTAEEAESQIANQSFDLVLRDWNTLLAQRAPKAEIIEQVLARVN